MNEENMTMNLRKKILAAAAVWGICCPSPVGAAVPLTLAESVEMALANNEVVAIGEHNVEEAAWTHKLRRRTKGPRVTWSSAAARIGGKYYEGLNRNHELYGDAYGAPAYNNEFTNNFQLQIPIFNPQIDGQINSARYSLNAADLNLENTKQTLRFQVIKGYYDLLLRRNQINVAQSAADMSAERLAMINEQYNEGTVAKSDLLTMEVELANYRQQINSAETDRYTAGETLNNLVGLPAGTVIEPKDELAYEPDDLNLPECLEYAMAHRPDRVSADYAVKKAEADLGGVKAENYPTLTGNAAQNYQGNGAFQQNHREDWTIGVNLGWTVFDNSQNSAKVHASVAALESAKARAEQLERQVRMEVNTAYDQLKTYENNIKITKLAMEQAEENNMIAQIRYEEGVDTILNLTNAQEKLTRARTNYFNALYGYNLSRATLYKAMGVPVDLDATLYVVAETEGKSSVDAVAAAQVDNRFFEATAAQFAENEQENAKIATDETPLPTNERADELAAEIANQNQ